MDGYPRVYPFSLEDYYFGNIPFSNLALDVICCSVLFTSLEPNTLAQLFQGATNLNGDLSNVQTADVRGCFFQMVDENHPKYLYWSHVHPSRTETYNAPLFTAFGYIEFPVSFECDWDSERGIARPKWYGPGYYYE